MKNYLLVLVLVLAIVASEASEKPRKHKKVRRIMTPKMQNDEADLFKILDTDEEYEKKIAEEVPPEDNRVSQLGECNSVQCGAGRVCELNEDGVAECVCISVCPVETESRRKVCSNHNETWDSDCSVYQQRCWCDTKDDRCKGENYRHIHIEYYGECREMPECTEGEMADFPRRMRDWLFNIMRDLADRNELTSHYLQMEKEAETNLTRRWTNAAIWKWCDLDGHPHDRSVSRHELFPIKAPLMALEHCIAPFLNSCDTDNNHRITLKEWTKCLEIDEDEIEDKCERINETFE